MTERSSARQAAIPEPRTAPRTKPEGIILAYTSVLLTALIGVPLAAPRDPPPVILARSVVHPLQELRASDHSRLEPIRVRSAFPTSSSESSGRWRRALLGGLIGAGAGAVMCTVLSNFVNEGKGVSTCTAKGYTIFAGGGAALGFVIGWRSVPGRSSP